LIILSTLVILLWLLLDSGFGKFARLGI
jgi:hypothetical protein